MALYSENINMEKSIIEIEYCIKCKWLNRASWLSQEILSTFSNDIKGVYLIPSKIAGILEIRCDRQVIWERSKEKPIPEIKIIKQKIRNIISPDKNLGHIDS